MAQPDPGLAHHRRLGPTEGLNSIIKKVKRVGAGFRSFANYRLRTCSPSGAATGLSSNPHPAETRRTTLTPQVRGYFDLAKERHFYRRSVRGEAIARVCEEVTIW